MKGIILAGGSGTRLHPITLGNSKQLLPVYDKPMIYYPLSTLMLAGIKDILIITTPHESSNFKRLLGDGSNWGISISYTEQAYPGGLAEAFVIGKDFIDEDNVCLILGDNIFYGQGLTQHLINAKNIVENENKSVVFAYYVNDPKRYGIIEFDNDKKILSIEEKPKYPKSNYAVVGLYFYPNDVIQSIVDIERSKRGELEITSVNNWYFGRNRLSVIELGRGFAWLDTGTVDSLIEASNFIQAIEKRQGLKISCLEEIAYKKKYISKEKLLELGNNLKQTPYGSYILKQYKTEDE